MDNTIVFWTKAQLLAVTTYSVHRDVLVSFALQYSRVHNGGQPEGVDRTALTPVMQLYAIKLTDH